MKPHKYRAQPTVVDNIRFDSKKEATRYGELKLLEKAGEITALQLQPEYQIIINSKLICKYKADFEYVQIGCDFSKVVEDVKGLRKGAAWAMYRLKKKLVEAQYGITIQEV